MSYFRHCRESGNPDLVEIPGFRVALAIASLPGMTPKLFNGFREHQTRLVWEAVGKPSIHPSRTSRANGGEGEIIGNFPFVLRLSKHENIRIVPDTAESYH